jgi:hypothetical protein
MNQEKETGGMLLCAYNCGIATAAQEIYVSEGKQQVICSVLLCIFTTIICLHTATCTSNLQT